MIDKLRRRRCSRERHCRVACTLRCERKCGISRSSDSRTMCSAACNGLPLRSCRGPRLCNQSLRSGAWNWFTHVHSLSHLPRVPFLAKSTSCRRMSTTCAYPSFVGAAPRLRLHPPFRGLYVRHLLSKPPALCGLRPCLLVLLAVIAV